MTEKGAPVPASELYPWIAMGLALVFLVVQVAYFVVCVIDILRSR